MAKVYFPSYTYRVIRKKCIHDLLHRKNENIFIFLLKVKYMDVHLQIQPVSYKRYFRCNNRFLFLVCTITEYRISRPATDGYHLYETPVMNLIDCKYSFRIYSKNIFSICFFLKQTVSSFLKNGLVSVGKRII